MRKNFYKKNILKFILSWFLTIFVHISAHAESKEKIETRPLENFTTIEASNAVNVILQKCDKDEKPEARIVCTDTDIKMDRIITHIHKGKLQIFIRKKSDFLSLACGITNNNNVTVYLKCQKLNGIEADSAAKISTDKLFVVEGEDFEINTDSAAKVNLTLKVTNLKVVANSASNVLLNGQVKNKMLLEASSASTIDTSEIDVDIVEAYSTSASSIKLKVKKNLKAYASSCASILYMGDPFQKDIERDSMGEVKRCDKKGSASKSMTTKNHEA